MSMILIASAVLHRLNLQLQRPVLAARAYTKGGHYSTVKNVQGGHYSLQKRPWSLRPNHAHTHMHTSTPGRDFPHPNIGSLMFRPH